MKLFGRLIVYIIIFFFAFSVSYVLALRFVPITFTPLKVTRWVENVFDSKIFIVKSQWVGISRINQSLVNAAVAAEDGNFMSHNGFDIDAIKKAIAYNKRHTDKRRGASTISQQTAKNVFCIPSRSWLRKGVESYFTLLIEPIWGKKRIMEVYLNIIETHENVYGAQATAREFYNKDAVKLNNYESSAIVAVLPHPLRSNLAAPSAYVVNRAARIRNMMRMVGTVNLDEKTKKEE